MDSSTVPYSDTIKIDYMARICGTANVESNYHPDITDFNTCIRNLNVDIHGLMNTSDFTEFCLKYSIENNVLKIALKSLWKLYKYDQEYKSFLLGTHSNEEFIKIAKEYAEPMQKQDINFDMIFSANCLFSAIGQPLTSFDLSLLLNIDCSTIEKNMSQIYFISDSNDKHKRITYD